MTTTTHRIDLPPDLARAVLDAGMLPVPCEPQPPKGCYMETGYWHATGTYAHFVFPGDGENAVKIEPCPYSVGDVVEIVALGDQAEGKLTPNFLYRRTVVEVRGPVDMRTGRDYPVDAEDRRFQMALISYLHHNPDRPWAWIVKLEDGKAEGGVR